MDIDTGRLTLVAPLDYESGSVYFALVVEVRDNGGNTDGTTIYIYVSDINDNTPTFVDPNVELVFLAINEVSPCLISLYNVI